MQNSQPKPSLASDPVRTHHQRTYRPRFQILVECRDEEDQKQFHARMVKERRKCRVLSG
jgi:hypothetical protein